MYFKEPLNRERDVSVSERRPAMEENVMNRKSFDDARRINRVQKWSPAFCCRASQRPVMTAGSIVAALLLIGAMVTPLSAQTYPTKPIRLILPFPPAGATDILGRIIGAKLSERLGQPVVPENRPGGGGYLGLEFTAKARPDGYTLVIGSLVLASGPSL
jgi:hypothetical protein